jgi:orotate phosphoribosyltransferase
LSYPEVRTFIRQHFVKAIMEHFPEPELVAGVATAGIAQGALVAQELGLPFAYVRSGKKDHGLTNQIEGEVRAGQNVVVVEDLISTGSSSLGVVQALKDAGCRIAGMVAIFTYELPKAKKAFEEASCRLVTLTDYDTLISRAVETGYLKEEELKILKDFKKSLS